MLRIQIEPREDFDEETSEFIEIPGVVLELEHSLLSLSKWESKFQTPFLGDGDKTPEQMYGYIEAMCLEPLEDPAVLQRLRAPDIRAIQEYINSPQSATTFGTLPGAPEKGKQRKERISAELIYYWLVALEIPWEAQEWHLNRLFALIRICNIKAEQQSGKKKKVNQAEAARQRAELNRQRREQYGTTG